VVGSVAVLAAAVVGFLAVARTDNAPGGREFDEADPADATTARVPVDYQDVVIGDVSVRLPPSWVWARLDEGIEGLGTQLVPDDPTLAADVDNRLRGLPRSALLLGLDEGDLGRDQFNTNVLVLELPMVRVDGTDQMRAAIGAEMEASNAEVSSVSYLASEEGPAIRVRYRLRLGDDEVDFLQYWYDTPAGTYTVSFSSDDLVDYVQMADAIGSSFDVDAAT
jgi:hypothetical protein